MKYFSCMQVYLKDKFPKVEWLSQSALLFVVLIDIAKLSSIIKAM